MVSPAIACYFVGNLVEKLAGRPVQPSKGTLAAGAEMVGQTDTVHTYDIQFQLNELLPANLRAPVAVAEILPVVERAIHEVCGGDPPAFLRLPDAQHVVLVTSDPQKIMDSAEAIARKIREITRSGDMPSHGRQ